jgi:hypothetical protein
MASHGELAGGRCLHRGKWQGGRDAGGQAFQQTSVGKPMTEQNLEQIQEEKIAKLIAQVERLREFIRTYTAVECRGQTFYPEWAERALRE